MGFYHKELLPPKLEGPLAGKQLSDLITMINNGDAYVNVHTEANPKGEIRGQLSSR
jgi:CHRD domain